MAGLIQCSRCGHRYPVATLGGACPRCLVHITLKPVPRAPRRETEVPPRRPEPEVPRPPLEN